MKLIYLGIAALILIFGIKTCTDKQGQINDFKRVLALKDQQVKYYKDDADRSHAVVIETQAESDVIKAVYQKQLDSISKIVKVKKVTEYITTTEETHSQGSGKIDTVFKHDTAIYQLKVNDGHLTFNADISKGFTYNYSFLDTLNIVKYQKHIGFLHLKKENYVDVFSSNPNTTITGLHQFKVADERKKPFALTIGVGASFNGRIQPTINATIGLNIIKF